MQTNLCWSAVIQINGCWGQGQRGLMEDSKKYEENLQVIDMLIILIVVMVF